METLRCSVVIRYLQRIVQQGTVITLVANSIHVCVLLFRIVYERAVVILIQDSYKNKGGIWFKRTLNCGMLVIITVWELFYHLRQCLQHRHPLPRCGPCQSGSDCAHKGSYHSGRLLHPCQSQTAED